MDVCGPRSSRFAGKVQRRIKMGEVGEKERKKERNRKTEQEEGGEKRNREGETESG